MGDQSSPQQQSQHPLVAARQNRVNMNEPLMGERKNGVTKGVAPLELTLWYNQQTSWPVLAHTVLYGNGN